MAEAPGHWPETIPAAAAAMVRPGRTYTPRPEQAALYDQLYRRVYLRLSRQLQPLYRQIRSIVNYPEHASDEEAED